MTNQVNYEKGITASQLLAMKPFVGNNEKDEEGNIVFESGESYVTVMKNGESVAVNAGTSTGILRKDQWEYIDETLSELETIETPFYDYLVKAGKITVDTKAFSHAQKLTTATDKAGEAKQSMDGMSNSNTDQRQYKYFRTPLPVQHAEVAFNLRFTAIASTDPATLYRESSISDANEALNELLEYNLLNGGFENSGESTYGILTVPYATDYGTTATDWTVDGADAQAIYKEIKTMRDTMHDKHFKGAYDILLGSAAFRALEIDYSEQYKDTDLLAKIKGLTNISSVQEISTFDDRQIVFMRSNSPKASMECLRGFSRNMTQEGLQTMMAVKFKIWDMNVPMFNPNYNEELAILRATVKTGA